MAVLCYLLLSFFFGTRVHFFERTLRGIVRERWRTPVETQDQNVKGDENGDHWMGPGNKVPPRTGVRGQQKDGDGTSNHRGPEW